MATHSRIALAAPAVLAALALLGAGCGDDESDSGGDTEFVAAVTQACDDAQARFLAENEDLTLSNDKKAFEREYREVNQPIYDDLLAELEAIEPPSGQEETYDALVASIRDASVVLLEDPVGIIGAGFSEKQTEATREIARLGEETTRTAEELGVSASCGGGTSGEASG